MQKVLYLRLLLSLLCILGVSHLNAQQTVFTGSCGATANDNLTWTLNTESNLLTISGSGAMADYDNSDNKAPWLSYADEDLVYLKLEEGLTHIGDYAFFSRTYLTSFRLPSTLQSIGDYAFARCFTVMYVEALAETAPSVGVNAFQDCGNGDEKLYYNYYDEDQYTYGYWAMYFKNVAPIYVDKVGDDIISIVNPHISDGINNGRHEINGTGAMYDYDNASNQAPYRTWTTQYPCDILSIEEGITHIGDYAFPKHNNSWIVTSDYTSCSIPLSVTTIGDGAFNQCFPDNSEVILLTANHNVTHIGDYAFHACGGQFSFPETLVHIGEETFSYGYLTSLSLPENLEYIGDRAFAGNYNLTGDITIPNSVTYLGMQAFGDCYSINGHVTLSANQGTIREQTFNMCEGIISVTIPEGITTIEELAFNYCSSMTGDLTIPNSVTNIGQSAFANCASLNGTLILPENLSTIEDNVFYDCKFTGSLVIPENVTSIGSSAFHNNRFTGNLNIPEGVTSIGYDAFHECTFDGTLNIPNSLTSISSSAFSGCDFTGTLNIHENVSSIGEYAFSECSNITELVLGRGLTEIDNGAFQECGLLSKVTSLATTAPTLETNVFTGISADATLYYPSSGEQSYTDKGWMQYFSNSINQMCGDFAFYDIDLTTGKLTISGSGAMWDYDGTTQAPWRQYATQITSLEIHDGITSIGDNAFYGMSALTGAVAIPESVTLIGESAFQGCTSINELTIYDGLTNIENYAFYLCVALNKVTTFATTAPTLGNNVFTNIAADATLYCQEEAEASYIEKGWDQYFSINAAPIYGGKCGDNITWTLNLTTGELVVTGTGAMWDYDISDDSNNKTPWFELLEKIKSLSLSEGITHIGDNAFWGISTNNSTLTLPSTLISIGEDAFFGGGFDGTLTIPNSVTSLERGAFSCNNFTEINISENIQHIANVAFYDNPITSINIPSGVIAIGIQAFDYCSQLKEIVISNTVTSIDNSAFSHCPIESCTVLATTAPYLNDMVFENNIYETATLYYHADATDYEDKGWFYYFANRYAIYTGTCGEDAYWTLNVTTGELRIYGTGAMYNYYVYQNGSYSRAPWRNYKDLITSVVVEEGITNVGNYAFYDVNGLGSYTSLTSFSLAGTITSIGKSAFENCTGLTGTISIPASVTSIGASAFENCTGITALNIAGSASIGEYAFSDCTGITSITKTNISKVTSIGNYAFRDCTRLTTVAIPSYVTSIGEYAFNGCTELTDIGFIPRPVFYGRVTYYYHDLTSIGNYAFDGCSKLVGMTKDVSSNPRVPQLVTALFIPYSVQTIGDYAFRNCTSIPELRFERGERGGINLLTSIGQYAFYGCTSIMGNLNLSATRLTSIGYRAFQGCRFENEVIRPGSIIIITGGTLSLPNTLTNIEDYAFYGTGFRTANFPESLQGIGHYAFVECSRLTAVDLSKTNIYVIGYDAFKNCTNLSSLQLPVNENYTEIRNNVFKGCTSLKEVVIPNNVTNIGTEAFYGCTAIERVVLPNNLDYSQGIGKLAFGKCPNIKEVYATQVPAADEYTSFINVLFPYTESAWNNYQQESGAFTVNTPIDNGNAVLYIPEGAEAAYTYRTGSGQYPNEWEKQFPVMIEGIYSGQCGENAYYIGNNASYYYHSETQTAYNGRSELLITGYGDMYNYDDNIAPWKNYDYSIDTINICDDITSVGNYAFNSLGIDVVIGGSGITHVGNYAFSSNQIQTISIADNAYIGNYAFQNCTRLEYDDFIANASYIGDYAFYNCDGLVLDTELNLKNATYIGARAFYDCAGFTGGLKIGKAITIGEYAFYQVNFTGDLVIPESVTSLGAYAFYGCDNFNGTLTLPETLETINNYTFYGCSGLTGELVIPNSIISINDRAFSGCSGFTGTLVIPENVTTIGSNAFSNCYGFTGLELNDNITTIGSSAFHYCENMTGELVLPNKLNNISNSAFNSVPFTDVVVFRTEPATLGTTVFNAITGNIYIPYQFRDAYLANANWASYNSNNKLVSMPTYTPLTTSVNHWVGLNSGIEPAETDRVALNTALAIADGKTLTIESFGYCGLNDEVYGHLTVEDGGQLYHNKAYNEATVEKNIIGYAGQQSTDNGQQTSWYTIASPLKEAIDLSNSNTFITSTTFDLYRYDEPTHTWQNAKEGEGSTNFQTIEPGRGYLYANAENTTLEFTGMLNTDAVTYDLTVDSEVLNGFHLIGNPFTHDITFNHLSADAELANGYYVLNGEGAWGATLGNEGDVIKAGQGALIKTTDAGTLTIGKELRATSNEQKRNGSKLKAQSSKLTISVSNSTYSDKAFVVFDKGVGLDKINHENENIPLLYIPQGDTDYAIAMMDENANEIPVSFEAMTMGQYTISLQQENCDFNELYLLDKETGEKVNILEEDYTFMATSSDNSERFVLLKDNGQQTTDNSHFAYVSGEELIINAEGVVQIIDVMGRIVYSNDVRSDNNRINVSGFTNAAYLVRCINGNDVKVQKIVIQ